MTRQVKLRATPKQIQFLNDKSRNLLMHGGFGSAKTRALCLKALYRARVPGARECLYRKYYSTLKATTLRTLIDGDGDVPPVLPPGSYTHNKSDKIIRIKGGGEIVYSGLDDPEKVRSLNLTGIGGDEVTELTEREFLFVDKRPRIPHPDGNQHYGVTNPDSPSHFLSVAFGISGGNLPKPGHSHIHTMPEDNHYLPASYIENLRNMTGMARKRYYEGLWVGSESLVYSNWNREIHVQPQSWEPKRVMLGIDDGFVDPFCVLRAHIDGDRRIHVARLVYAPGMFIDAKIRAVKSMMDGVDTVVVDPSAAGLIAQLVSAGVPAKGADNSLTDGGTDRVRNRLEVQGDGRPRITVEPTCVELIREMEMYENKRVRATSEFKDDPKDENNHACDPLRYIVNELDAGQSFSVTVYDGHGREVTSGSRAAPDPFASDAGWDSPGTLGGRSHFIGF